MGPLISSHVTTNFEPSARSRPISHVSLIPYIAHIAEVSYGSQGFLGSLVGIRSLFQLRLKYFLAEFDPSSVAVVAFKGSQAFGLALDICQQSQQSLKGFPIETQMGSQLGVPIVADELCAIVCGVDLHWYTSHLEV